MRSKRPAMPVHTVYVKLRIRSVTKTEARSKVLRIVRAVIGHWPRGAWDIDRIEQGWR